MYNVNASFQHRDGSHLHRLLVGHRHLQSDHLSPLPVVTVVVGVTLYLGNVSQIIFDRGLTGKDGTASDFDVEDRDHFRFEAYEPVSLQPLLNRFDAQALGDLAELVRYALISGKHAEEVHVIEVDWCCLLK